MDPFPPLTAEQSHILHRWGAKSAEDVATLVSRSAHTSTPDRASRARDWYIFNQDLNALSAKLQMENPRIVLFKSDEPWERRYPQIHVDPGAHLIAINSQLLALLIEQESSLRVAKTSVPKALYALTASAMHRATTEYALLHDVENAAVGGAAAGFCASLAATHDDRERINAQIETTKALEREHNITSPLPPRELMSRRDFLHNAGAGILGGAAVAVIGTGIEQDAVSAGEHLAHGPQGTGICRSDHWAMEQQKDAKPLFAALRVLENFNQEQASKTDANGDFSTPTALSSSPQKQLVPECWAKLSTRIAYCKAYTAQCEANAKERARG